MSTVLEFGPVTALLVISVVLALIIANISRVMGPHRPTYRKSVPYESGMKPIGPATRRLASQVLFGRRPLHHLRYRGDFLLALGGIHARSRRVRAGGDGGVHHHSDRRLRLRMEERWFGMGVSSKLGNLGIVTTTVEQAVNHARTGAMWPLLFGLACCAIEYMSSQASSYDLSRFRHGIESRNATSGGLADRIGTS